MKENNFFLLSKEFIFKELYLKARHFIFWHSIYLKFFREHINTKPLGNMNNLFSQQHCDDIGENLGL